MHRVHRVIAAAGLAMLAACGGSDAASPATTAVTAVVGHHLMQPAAAAELLARPPTGLVVVDVRTPAEFASGHIANAIDVDLNGASFTADIAALDRGVPYFVYCHSGHRSAAAVSYMEQLGFRSIYELDGGIAAWQAAGLPTS